MSIQSEITRISGNVSDALDAIEGKGVTIPTGSNSDDLATLIEQISGGLYSSGSMATFNSSAAGTPVSSLIADINAVQSGSGTPSSSNIRTLAGFSSVDIPCAGKNLLVDNKVYPITHSNITTDRNADGSYTITGNKTSSSAVIFLFNFADPNGISTTTQFDYKKWLPDGNYKAYIHAEGLPSGAVVRLQIYSYNSLASSPSISVLTEAYTSDADPKSFTVTADKPFILCRLHFGSGTYSNLNAKLYPMIYRADEADNTWASPMGSKNVPLGQTVWGGQVDAITGDLKVTHGQIASYNGETLPGAWLSDRDVYAAGTSPSTGAQVVYELATPVTSTITPLSDVAVLYGENNIWSVSGDIQVTIGGNSATIEELDVSASGTYTASGGVDGYSPVVVPAGTAGTPTATKGTVSNHSVSVTPSVINTTGYITGSTKTGTAVTVSASELVSGDKSITANGTNIDVTDYATVSVSVSGTSKNTQVIQGTTRSTSTTLAAIGSELTVSKAGTYDIYWSAARTNTSSGYTWGTQLYIGGTAHGSENTTWSNHVQNNHLTNVSLTANQKLRVYGRGRGGNYYIYAPMLAIVEV